MFEILGAGALIFLSGFVFFESDSRRSVFLNVAGNGRKTLIARCVGYALLSIALWILIDLMGLARGVPTWLGMMMVLGLASILIASWRKPAHRIAGVTATVVAGVSLVALGLGGL